MSGSRGGGDAGRGVALPPRLRAVLAVGILGLILGVLWGVSDVPRYTASASVLVTAKGGAPADETELAQAAQLAESAGVADKAAGLIGGDVGGADLLSDIAAVPDAGAGAVVVEATADSPDFAAAAANGYALALTKKGGKKFEVGAEATVPTAPSESRSAVRWGLLGLLVGLVIGAAGAFAASRLRRPGEEGEFARADVHAEPEPVPAAAGAAVSAFDFPERPVTEVFPAAVEEVEEEPEVEPEPEVEQEPEDDLMLPEDAFGVPVLASFDDPAELIRLGEGQVIVDRPAAHTLLDLVDDLRLGTADAPRTVAVLDVAGGDGSLPVVTGLAAAASEAELRTILVEADLEQPWLAEHVGVEPSPGLRDYLLGTAGPRDVLRSTRARAAEARVPLVCVPAGEVGEDLSAGVGGERFAALMERLPRVYDLVLVAGPPVSVSGDAAAIAGLAEGVILVSADDDDAGPRIADAVEALGGATILTGVLTRPSAAQSRPQSAV